MNAKIFFLVVFLSLTGIDLFAQMVVDNRHVRLQMQREVITRWNQFRPLWYYQLFHNDYRTGGDKRNMLVLIPTLATVSLTNNESEKFDQISDTLFIRENLKAVDRIGNKRYHLLGEKRKLDNINSKLNELHLEAIKRNIALATRTEALTIHQLINERLELILDSYMDDSKKGEELRIILEDYEHLYESYVRTIHHQGNIFKMGGK
jgi:hypothetical protein